MIQFSKKIKQFIAHQRQEHSYLFIQCDLNEDYASDIINCARHTIVESFKEALIQDNNSMINNFIILLINVPKENVEKFIGFQLSYWSCYHVDEIEDYPLDLPPFESLHNKSLSSLLKDSIPQEPFTEKKMDMGATSSLNLSILFKKLAHISCSLITDTNIARTISRINIFLQLCDDPKFVRTLAKRLIRLQEAKEQLNYKSNEWFAKEAASIKNINEYSTLRRSCQFYFETKLSPLLAFMLSCIDQYANLEAYAGYIAKETRVDNWKSDLWLRILENDEISRLDYSEMRVGEEENFELNHFDCKSDLLVKINLSEYGNESEMIKPCLPFFWVIIEQLNNLYKNHIDSLRLESKDQVDIMAYVKSVSEFLQSSGIFVLLKNSMMEHKIDSSNNEQFLSDYISDFLVKNCVLNSPRDLEVIKTIFIKLFATKRAQLNVSDITQCLPIVHYLYGQFKEHIGIYLGFTAFDQAVNDADFLKSDE